MVFELLFMASAWHICKIFQKSLTSAVDLLQVDLPFEEQKPIDTVES